MAFANFLWHHSEFDEKTTKERTLAKIRSTKQTRKLERFLIKLRTNSQNWSTFCSSQVVVTRPCIRLCYTVEFESYLQYITSIEMASINICMGLSKRICFKDHSVTVLQGWQVLQKQPGKSQRHLDKLIDPKLIVGGLQGFGGLLPGYQVTEEQEPILGQPFLSLGH